MYTATTVHEASVSRDIHFSRFDCEMPPIAARPVTAEMTEAPTVRDPAFLLFFGKAAVHNQSDDSEVDVELVSSALVGPVEKTAKAPLGATISPRWRGVKPAFVFVAK